MIAAIIATSAIVGMAFLTISAMRRMADAERRNALLEADLAELTELKQELTDAQYFPRLRARKEITA